MTGDPRILSLFSGYGGLDIAVQAVLGGGTVIAHAEYEPPTKANPKPTQAAARVLAHRFPGVPNLGDVSAVDWASLAPVDVMTGGFPCTDVSAAGKREGLRPDTRSGLWTQMAYAISVLRPSLVVIENVRGLLSADAHSELEPCPWCMGDGDPVVLRAHGAVLGDLAGIGYDAQWIGIPASAVGAPHGRFRIFIVAWPVRDTSLLNVEGAVVGPGGGGRASGEAGGPDRIGVPDPASSAGRVGDGDDVRPRGGTVGRRPAAGAGAVADTDDVGRDGRAGELGAGRRPEPADGGGVASDSEGDGRDERRPEPTGLVGGPDAAVGGTPAAARPCRCQQPCGRRLPGCPDYRGSGPASDAEGGGEPREPEGDDPAALGGPGLGAGDRVGAGDLAAGVPVVGRGAGTVWGPYAAAVERWERLTRPAPPPTEGGARGGQRLSPRFVEWMMGLPEGWVTDVPGVSRNDQLKMLGNGVVPQQAAAALAALLGEVWAA